MTRSGGFLVSGVHEMQLDEVLRKAIDPALALLPEKMDTPRARLMMLCIGLQESRFTSRQQIGGPARSFWQMEAGGGIRGVINHKASRKYAQEICPLLDVPCCVSGVYAAMSDNDVLGAVFARLLLYTDAAPLPAIGDANGAWEYYIRNWRPGKPHPDTWKALYMQAMEAVTCSP